MAETKATTLFALAVVKSWCGVTDGSADALLVLIADAISERIEAVTKRVFVTRTIVESRDGDGSRRLILRKFPVVSVSAFTVKDTPDQVTPTPFVQGTDFDVNLTIGELRMRSRRLTKGFQNLAATYTAGWGARDALTLPGDIYEAGLNYCKAEWDEKSAGAVAATSVSLGNATFVLKPQLPYGIKCVLEQWTARRLA